MKRTLLITFVLALSVVAQTTFTPTPIDWRYRLTWTDPNAAGLVASWIVHATNNASTRTVATTTTTADLLPIMNGAPAGIYTLYTTPVSQLGAEGDPGDTIQVSWPGGNGKLRGGTLLRVGK